MPARVPLPWTSLGLTALILPLALTLTPGQAQSQIEAGSIKEALKSAMQGQRPERPKTGRNVVEALQAGKKYTTFLAIAEKAGMTPFLNGTTTDTTKPDITIVEDSNTKMQISTSGIKIEGDLPPSMNATQLKSDIADQLRDAMGDIMMGVVAEEGKITVFAPTDAALAKLPKARLDSLQTNPVAAAEFVRAHVVNRGVYRDAFGKIRSMTPLAGPGLRIGAKTASVATINSITLVEADIAGDNGVAHGIDGILDPHAKPPQDEKPAAK